MEYACGDHNHDTFKETHTNAFGAEREEEECWGDCMDENLLETNWYKEDGNGSNVTPKPYSLGPKITVSDEELS